MIIIPKPNYWLVFNLVKTFSFIHQLQIIVFPGLMIGSSISKRFAAFLEENELFVPEDDDVDWAAPVLAVIIELEDNETSLNAFIFPSSSILLNLLFNIVTRIKDLNLNILSPHFWHRFKTKLETSTRFKHCIGWGVQYCIARTV